jgi:CheY-like chemotaxis protein
VDASTTRLYGGTGLGLAISQAIVTRMGGTIQVSSTPGEGSRFWFEAPFEPIESAERPAATRRAAGRRREITGQLARWNSATDDAAEIIVPVWPQGTPVPSMSVLVAEDNPVNQRTAQLLLERAGHVVTLVGNGLEAVEAVKGQSFGAVLMDIDMPIMDGLTASRAIRDLGGGIEQPRIVAVTASASPADRRKCEAAGMDLYLTKPIRSDDLIASLCAIASRDLVDRQERAAGGSGIDELPPELVAELHTQFVTDSEKTLTELDAAFASNDPREVARLAHRLRGSSSALAATALAAACAAVEGAARTDRGITAAEFDHLRNQTELAIARFRA